ncbi:hypothetical protein ACO0LM_02330 [Undibacterium sp. Di26W]|uniref:hypothetical protein n=1 Tax=Undibacterium sp. Di26W TaxID=3413035 RepID=UPI003BF126C7
MSGYRQSALLLHGLGVQDQRWILDQLSKDDQVTLRSHLAELKDLGIPVDRSMLANLGISETGGKLDALQAASAADMQLLLSGEPVWLIKQVLSLENWPWKQEYLASMTSAQADKLKHMQLPQPGPRARQSLRSHLLQELKLARNASFNTNEDEARPNSWSQRLLRVLGR